MNSANLGYLMVTFHRFDNNGTELETDVLFSQTYARHQNINMVEEVKALFPNLKWKYDDGNTCVGSDYFQLCCYPSCQRLNDSYFLATWSTDAFDKETSM